MTVSNHCLLMCFPCQCRYEVPDIKFEGLAMRFMDIRKRVYEVSHWNALLNFLRLRACVCS